MLWGGRAARSRVLRRGVRWPADRDRGKRPDHRRSLRQLLHREIHRRRLCHHPRRRTYRVPSAGR